MSTMMQDLPKVELHCHLFGVLNPAIVRAIRQQVADFPIDVEEMAALYPVDSIESFWRWWQPIHRLRMSDPVFFHPILQMHIQQLKAHNVRYAEVNIPVISVEQVQGLRQIANAAETRDFQIEFIAAVGRQRPMDESKNVFDLSLDLFQEGLICGFMLVGDEGARPVSDFRPDLKRLRAAGIGIEIHAGEWRGPDSVWDALNNGVPQRIGHGVRAFEDDVLVQQLIEDGVHIEMCPTSNVLTGSINDMRRHPLGRARELGMDISINTDDPGVFSCDMTSEFQVAADQFGFTRADFEMLYEQSLVARFQPQLRIDPPTF